MAGEAWRMDGRRSCDTCRSSAAAVYCRAEVAYRCGACDARAHGAGARHERVWVCEVCESAPAAVTCRADAAALCAACDADIHSANPLAHRHERLPVAPLPAAEPAKDDGEAEAATWLLPNLSYKGLMEAPAFFFQDMDPYLDMEYASSMDVRCDGVVPVQAKAAPDGGGGGGMAAPAATLDGCVELDFAKASYRSYSYNGQSEQVTSSEVGVVPDGGSWAAEASNTCGVKAAASVATDREARVMRYREKRKNRRFEKTIRYASRKAYAETRPRIKGRFVKRADAPPRSHGDAAAAAASFVAGAGYGVVPSY